MSWELSTFLTGASTPELGNVSNGEIPHAVIIADRDIGRSQVTATAKPKKREKTTHRKITATHSIPGYRNSFGAWCFPSD